MAEALVEMVVSEVRTAVPLRPGQEAGLVVLAERDSPFRVLHIYVGQAEARAIQTGLHGIPPARPSTWDLLLSALALFGARLDKAVITSVEQQRHFFASLGLSKDGESYSLACRPSDAIALAVRVEEATLFAAEEVLVAAGQLAEPL